MTRYVTLREALDIHEDQIRRYGGASGIRDIGLLEAALYRPQSGQYADIIQEASALWESLSQNHPFVDGNKRVAFALTAVFLRINGLAINANPQKVYADLMALYEGHRFTFDALDEWLRSNIERID